MSSDETLALLQFSAKHYRAAVKCVRLHNRERPLKPSAQAGPQQVGRAHTLTQDSEVNRRLPTCRRVLVVKLQNPHPAPIYEMVRLVSVLSEITLSRMYSNPLKSSESGSDEQRIWRLEVDKTASA